MRKSFWKKKVITCKEEKEFWDEGVSGWLRFVRLRGFLSDFVPQIGYRSNDRTIVHLPSISRVWGILKLKGFLGAGFQLVSTDNFTPFGIGASRQAVGPLGVMITRFEVEASLF